MLELVIVTISNQAILTSLLWQSVALSGICVRAARTCIALRVLLLLHNVTVLIAQQSCELAHGPASPLASKVCSTANALHCVRKDKCCAVFLEGSMSMIFRRFAGWQSSVWAHRQGNLVLACTCRVCNQPAADHVVKTACFCAASFTCKKQSII